MKDIKSYVENLLKNYPDMKRQMKALGYELEWLQRSLRPAAIENQVFAHSGGERVSCTQPRDQTADIVVEHVDSQRNARYHALKSVLYTMALEIRRLEYYLSLLPNEESDVIRLACFEGLSWNDIAKATSLTDRTMQRRRKRGIDRLVGFYTGIDSLPLTAGDMWTQVRFISYLHEERYSQCLRHMGGQKRTVGSDAMLYIISGCNELWDAGADTFLNFETRELIPQNNMTQSFSPQAAKLLRFAYCCMRGIPIHQLGDVINSYFQGLEYPYLEFAIEALRLAVLPIL